MLTSYGMEEQVFNLSHSVLEIFPLVNFFLIIVCFIIAISVMIAVIRLRRKFTCFCGGVLEQLNSIDSKLELIISQNKFTQGEVTHSKLKESFRGKD